MSIQRSRQVPATVHETWYDVPEMSKRPPGAYPPHSGRADAEGEVYTDSCAAEADDGTVIEIVDGEVGVDEEAAAASAACLFKSS